jgi:hypothetical protein
VLDPDERDVVDLVHNVVGQHAGQRGLELAGKVGEVRVADEAALDLLDRPGRVDQLILGDAGDGGAKDDPRAVSAGFRGLQPDRLQPRPDLGCILDAHPVQLDVLPIGEISGVAGEVAGDLANDTELRGGQRTAIYPNPEHEVLVLELMRLQ